MFGPFLVVIKFVESTYYIDRKTKCLWLFLFVLLRARKLASAHWLPWTTREVSSPCPPSSGARSSGENSNFHVDIELLFLFPYFS